MHNLISAQATRHSHSFAISFFSWWCEGSQAQAHVQPWFSQASHAHLLPCCNNHTKIRSLSAEGSQGKTFSPLHPPTGLSLGWDSAVTMQIGTGGRKGGGQEKRSTKLVPLLLFKSCFFSSERTHSVNSTAWDQVHAFSLVGHLAHF